MSFERGVAQTVQAVMVAAADHFTPTAPSGNLAASISKDGAGFAACANAPTSVGNGLVTVLLTATETTCDYYCVRFTGDDVDPVMVPMYTEAAWTATRAGYLTEAVATATNLATLAAQFTGITSLANWLRALARKDTADATALSEINTGGGAYDAATDSQEGLRDTLPAAVSDSVWDEAQADHTTAGSTGKSLSDAGSAGDPWATDVPGDYEEGTAGHRIGVLLTGGGGITLQAASPTVVVDASGEVVGGDGRLVAVRGCTHNITWERAGSDFTGHTIVLTCRDELEEADDDDDSEAAFTLEAVVVSATQFTTTLTPTHTDELTVGQAYWYQIKDLTTNENLLNRGRLEVVQSVVKRTA
jgi:hypothetical protein